MSRIRNPTWENNENLKADIQKYVLQNLPRKEVLDFLGRDYPQYAWSLPTLSRRMAPGRGGGGGGGGFSGFQHHDQFGHETCFRSVWSSDIFRSDRPLIMKKQVLNGNLQVFWLYLVSYRAQTTRTLEMATINLWISWTTHFRWPFMVYKMFLVATFFIWNCGPQTQILNW